MIIGFTGTRAGMTVPQKVALGAIFKELSPTVFHHGDCVGADAEAHDLVAKLVPSCRIEVHPPYDSALRAWKVGAVVFAPITHFARNRAIVEACELLIGASVSPVRLDHGGTWYTIDRAVKRKKQVRVVWPDGRVTET